MQKSPACPQHWSRPSRGAHPAARPEGLHHNRNPRRHRLPGLQWKEVWEVSGNNADGIIGATDGGLLIAQNDNSDVVKLDKNGKPSEIAWSDTNTGEGRLR